MWKTAFRDMVCLSRPYPFKFFKGCLPQILLRPFLNILFQIPLWVTIWPAIGNTRTNIWNIFKVNNRSTRATSMRSPWCLYCSLGTYFTHFSSVFISDFEQANTGWTQDIVNLFLHYNSLSTMHPKILSLVTTSVREKCPYLEFFWYVFSCIRTEYRIIRSISPYSVWMRENTDQKNSEYGHFSRSAYLFVTNYRCLFRILSNIYD